MDEGVAGDRVQAAGLPPEAVVVRGGIMEPELLARSAERALRKVGVYAISVWASASMDAAGIVRAARLVDPDALGNRKMCTSTVGAIEAVGFHLEAFGRPGHCRISPPERDQPIDWGRLLPAFGRPQPMPGGE